VLLCPRYCQNTAAVAELQEITYAEICGATGLTSSGSAATELAERTVS
jgi:hypothetical protein